MRDYQRQFLRFAIEQGVLAFGEFRLKSGRVSPWFFNAGRFDNGLALARLGDFYAEALVHSGLAPDCLFGPAYKGIPLVVATAVALAARHGRNYPVTFNRKEAKDHGEGGRLVGAPLSGRVVIVDDVITAGTAVRESVDIIRSAGAEVGGVLVALDREERGAGSESAIQEVERAFATRVVAVAGCSDLIEYLQDHPSPGADIASIRTYRETYGPC
jgi:orotate phosphoribosyltransferase